MAQFELITTQERFDALESGWESLHRQSAGPLQLFQDWTWISHWWRHVASHGANTLAIVVARRDDVPVLIWPWVICRRATLRILQPTGGLLSCFDDAVVSRDVDALTLLEEAWAFTLSAVDCDAVELRAVHVEANIAPLMRVAGKPIGTTSAPAIDLTAIPDFDSYLASRSKKMRQNQRRSHKFLGERGAVSACGDDRQLAVETAIDQCLEFKADWLNARGLSGKTLVSDEARLFLKRVASIYRQRQTGPQLCVSSLTLDARPVSIGIGFRFGGCHFEYLGGFDYQLEQIGPGRLRMEAGIRSCFSQGITSYNMLTPQTAFKRIWTHESPAVSHYIVATSLKGRLYRDVFMRRLRPFIKRRYNSLPASLRGRLGSLRLWG